VFSKAERAGEAPMRMTGSSFMLRFSCSVPIPPPCFPYERIPDRHSAWGEKDGNAIAHDERPRVIHLKPTSPLEFHREDTERLDLSEAVESTREVVSCHTQALVDGLVGEPPHHPAQLWVLYREMAT
jgi:hypothetical protein